MRDLNARPTFYGTSGRLSANTCCPCGNTVNPDVVDSNGKAFSDAASPAVGDITKYRGDRDARLLLEWVLSLGVAIS